MEKQQEIVKLVWVDEYGNTNIEEITKQKMSEFMEYASTFNDMADEDRNEIERILDKLNVKDLTSSTIDQKGH